MSKHTPGPWEVFICDDGKEWSGWPLSIVQKDTDKTIVRQGGHWPYTWDESISRDEALANARLIAAAPELLKALEDLYQYSDAIVCYASTMNEHEPNRIVYNAKKIIDRIKGE